MKTPKPVLSLSLTALMMGLVVVPSMPTHGQAIPGYSDDVRYAYDAREIALLPRYCIHTQLFRDNVPGGNDPAEIKRWKLAMGPTFDAMHHYCWGLMKTNRANLLARDQRWRTFYLRDSIGEFDYVINRAPPDFKLLPEILTKKGENLLALDRNDEGLHALRRAIELKPDYWPPYAAISDHYRKIGDLGKAREWLEEGLSVTPDIGALKRRMAELDAVKANPMTASKSASPQQPR
jgi:tetratricopeptide (TPR) repeat protein